MKEKDHSLFSLRGGYYVIAINNSFDQRRNASWLYRLKSNVFNFFDIFPIRRQPEEDKVIFHFCLVFFYYFK